MPNATDITVLDALGVQQMIGTIDKLLAVLGALGDSAWSGSGNATSNALLKAIANSALSTSAVPVSPDTAAHALLPAPSSYRLLSAAASTNGANIKTSPGTVKSVQGYNAKASAVYLKFYNKASSPTVGTDTPVKTLYLPATTAFVINFPTGVSFSTGIGIALTGAGADNDTTALSSGDILGLNVDYH